MTRTAPLTDTRQAVHAALLIDHPAHYVSPALRSLSDRPELHTSVYYWDAAVDGLPDADFGRHVRWASDLHSGHHWWAPDRASRAWHRGVAVWRRLSSVRPDVLLCYGWCSPVARLGIIFAWVTRTPLLLYGDTNDRATGSRRHPRLRKALLRALLRSSSGAIATGGANRDFYLAHGLRQEQIHHGVLPADVARFAAAGEGRAREQAAGGLPLIIGYAGKLISLKAVDDLIEAAARLPGTDPWELWVIGDGVQRSRLETLVGELALSDRVRFLGFQNSDVMPALMAAIDVLVLPSRQEGRGLVAIEAMAAGAAAIVSSATGLWGAGDVIQHEHSGLVYPTGDIRALAGCLRRLMTDPELRYRLALRGRANALRCGPADFAITTAAALVAAARPGDHVAQR